jgi:hypothetical protein
MPDEFATREVIVLPDAPTAVERSAAKELADGIERMTGRLLPIIAESTVPEPSRRFYVGATRAAGPAADWKPDEILVKPVADGVILTGHPQRGAIYAVDTYLEDVCGVRWWTSTEAHYPSYGRVPQPAAEIRHASPFTYRETYYLDGFDADFKVRLKGNVSSLTRFMFAPMNFIPPEKGGDHRLYFFKGRRSAYHSFFEILPPSEHFAAHPEWFSLRDGERRAEQLCLVNPAMKERFIAETLRRLREDPAADFIQVSQNDGTGGACECAGCQAVIAEEGGAASGFYLRFVNDVAAAVEQEFPHVTVDTFAYHFTRKPPAKARPRHNVTVRLCDITSGFNEPLETRRLDDGFTADLEAWSRIAPGRLYVWDYVANFSSYMLPRPNLGVLAANVRLFARSGAIGVFEQGDALCTAGAFAPLMHWLLAHLLWNPAADEKALVQDFLGGYYGPGAAPLLKRYLDGFNSAAARHAAQGKKIGCYHRNIDFFITPAEAREARGLMAAAVAAAERDGRDFARRVRREKLSIDHAFLLNWQAWGEKGDYRAAVNDWIETCREFGVAAFRETTDRGDFPNYCKELLAAAPAG